MSMNLHSNRSKEASDDPGIFHRAMNYGDGLFETIRVFAGHIPFMPLHWSRMEEGLKVLGFNMPLHWSGEFFKNQILSTIEGNARVRINVWRAPGGLFLPTDHNPNFQISSSPLATDRFEWKETGLTVRLCENVRLSVDKLSGLKTLGSTRYVAAAMEAREKAADDVILLNQYEQVCEASSSNVLWLKNGTVYMPAAASGQVSGTFQKTLTGVLRQEDIEIVEKAATFAELLEADELLLCNAIQGIRWVHFLEGKEFTCTNTYRFHQLMDKYLATEIAKSR